MGVRISVRTTVKSENLHVEGSISLAERFMFLLVVLENPLQVPYALILSLPIGPLRGTVLGSSPLLRVRNTRLNKCLGWVALTERTEGGAFLYLFSRFLFGTGLWATVDLVVDVVTARSFSCFIPGWGDAVAGDEMGLGYIPDETVLKSESRGISN